VGRSRAFVIRLVATVTATLVAALLGIVGIASAGSGPSVGGAAGETTYSVGATPSVDGVADAPWNTSQGDPTLGTPYYEQPNGATGATSLLFPTYTPSSNPTYETTIGGVTEPNLAVYPSNGATSPTFPLGVPPYPSGVVGTPGPDDDYCASGGANPETGAVNSEPANTILPFSPYYFPDVVRNADGTLTGYFDYRPKDTDEAITVARSSDGGVTWTTEGEALEQNPGYCATADTNDDGQGHPYVAPIGSTTDLYTLQRAAGDNTGIGLLVHQVNPSASNPLTALPSSEPVGIDPNTFVTSSVVVGASGSAGVAIPVSTLGQAGSPEQIVNGSYEDVPAGSTASSSSTIINCTGPTSVASTPPDPGSLTGCTAAGAGSVTVNPGDDLIQVIATANPLSTSGSTPCTGTTSVTVPAGPNNEAGTGGMSAFCFTQPTTTVAPITAYWWGSLAPDRIYVDGHAMYCNSVSSGLVKFENCTSPTGPFTATQGDAITADPIIPPSATMTTGLLAPDGIVGTLANYTSSAAYDSNGGKFNGQSVPSNATVMLYTEKLANYFIEGTTNGYISAPGNYKSGTITLPLTSAATYPFGQQLNFQPSPFSTEPLPASAQYPSIGSFTVYAGVTDSSGNFIQQLNCTSWQAAPQTGSPTPPAGSVNLMGCTGQGTSAETIASGTDVGGPNAAVVPYSVISQTGEGKNGKTSGPTELFGNNEDYEVVRAAYTTNGVSFTDLGVISGDDDASGQSSNSKENNGSYDDISNPFQQASPLSSGSGPITSPMTACGGTTGTSCVSPADATPGSSDTVELRWPGSRGTIIQNPDGSYGMFLSGAWATDADSDAFNQTFYTSSTDGVHWTTPQVVLSTDYTFSASAAQDAALAGGSDVPLGVSAYYSGRAYGPAVVQNPNGTLTMVFAGYRVPKGMPTAGQLLGTNTSDRYTVGATDPALYRNILTMTLSSQTSPAVATTSTVTNPSSPDTYGNQVTYTDTVAVNSPGTGIPTGSVDFYDGGTPIAGCQNVVLSDTATDTATCQTTPSSAGAHTITATYSGDSNYAGSTNSPAFSEQVNPATLTITASSPSMTYGGSVPTVTAGYSGFVNGDSSSSLSTQPTCSTGASVTSPVSSSPASTCTGASDPDYTISYIAGNVTVTPAPLTAFVSGSQTYGSATQAFAVDGYSGFVNSDDASVVSGSPACSTSVTASSPAGTYPGTISGCGGLVAANYSISYSDDGFTVNPAALTITASSASMTYGGSVPAITAGYSGFVNGDSSSSLSTQPTCSTGASATSPVTSSPATSCTGATDPNYTISYVAGSVTVNPAPLTAFVSGSQTYGSATQTFAVDSYSGFVNSDDASVVSGSLACSTSVTGSSPAGTYPGTISGCGGLSAANYSIGYTDDGFTVNPAALTITAASPSTTYGTIPAIGAGYSGFVNGDSSSSLTAQPTCSTIATVSSPVSGSPYATSCTGASDPNYTISYVAGSLTLGQAPLIVYVSGSQTYGSSAQTFAIDGYSGFVNSDDASVVSGSPACSSSVTAASLAGTYPGTISGCSGLAAANYSISYTDDGFTVNPAALTITAASPSTTYGTIPAIGAGYSGFVNNDTASSLTAQPICSTTATASSPVSSSPYATSCTGASDPNYTISYVGGSLTIGPAALKITASSPTMTYGGTVPAITAAYSGFENNESVGNLTTQPTCTVSATSASSPGGYPTSCTGASDPNYTISYVAGSLTVDPAVLTITASSGSMSYGGSVPTITAGYSGFVNHDDHTSLTTQPTCSTTAKSSSPVSGSPYPSTCSGASDPNYTIDYVAGTVTVNPAALKITASSPSTTYGTIPVITAAYSGFKNGDSAASLTHQPTCATTATTSSPVSGSPYTTSCSGAVDTNYTTSYVNGSLTIKPASLKITASSATMTYGGSVPVITASYSGFENGENAGNLTKQPTCTTSAKSASPVSGSPYTTSCSGAVDPNYTISYVCGKVTVTKAPLTITASSGSMTYGGTVPTITASYSGFVNGDSHGSLSTQPTCSTRATSSSSVAGSPYASSCSGASDPNYAISYVNGTVTVTPATTHLTYTGPTHVSTTSSLIPTASLSSPVQACEAAQTITFALDPNPLTGAHANYTLETAKTTTGGSATGAAISSKKWLDGSYTLSASFAGTTNCDSSTASAQFSVTTP
jgi:hypothetical protein